MCVTPRTLRRLIADPDPAHRPDGVESFNPTAFGRPPHGRVVAFAHEHGLSQIGGSDAHTLDAIGRCWTTFPGRSAEDLRRAILDGTTHAHGSFHGASQVGTFGRQLRKYGRDARDELTGRLRRTGTGRDHGYPGGRSRPPRFVHPEELAEPPSMSTPHPLEQGGAGSR
jgi:hypothetical protein